MENQYNMLVDMVGIVLVGAILLVEGKQAKRGDPLNAKLLHYLMLCCVLVFLTDIPGLAIDGCSFFGARTLLWVFDTAYWILQAVYCWLWLMFADYWAFGSRERLRKSGFICALPLFAEILLVLTNPLTGWVFTIDAANIYARGSHYAINLLPFLLYIAAALIVTVYGYRKSNDPEQKRRSLSLLVYMFLPVCGVAFEAFVYGMSWVWPMVALSLLMVYLNVQQQAISEEQLAAAALKQQMSDNRMAIMLSQIQPHFLYNALSSITELCDEDPKTAKLATIEFSRFLRGNLSSLTADKPISFEQELEHTKHYLALEQLRFPDKLQVEYDIKTTLFRMPTLSLQPIVENAVRYGVTKKEEGGTVTISTRETDDAYVLTVSDNGMGFDPEAPHADGRTHIGIQNVRERLARMCEGKLLITSTFGEGTVAVITIPKGA